MINAAWPLRPLGELFDIGAGKTMSAAGRAGEKKTPFLRTSNVLWDEIDLSTVDEMAIPQHELPEKLVAPGDLLVCEGGEIGRAAIWNGELATMSFQNHLHRLRPKQKNIVPRFYVYFLQSGFTQLGVFEGAGNKTTIPNLSRNRLAALDVPQPGFEEQRDITAALARVRQAMKLHDKSLEVAQDLKRAAMRALFTKGLRSETQKDTEIGLVPESWEVRVFSDVVELQRGFDLPTQDRVPGSVAVFGSNGIVGSHSHTPDKLPSPGVMVGRSGSVGKVQITNAPYWPLNTTLFVKNTKGVIVRFLYHWLDFLNLAQFAQGVSVPTLNRNTFAGFRVGIPTLEDQHEIVAILDAIDQKIDLHRRKRTVLDELFKSLLHKLMTGEVRVADLDLSAMSGALEPEVA
jgi:type I restriction enzyme S subunit